jgi:hypothetical protein
MRPVNPSRGTTLPELLLLLTLLLGFGSALHAVVGLSAAQATLALRRAAAARDQSALWALAARELTYAAAGDVMVPSPTSLEFARPIGEGPVCAVSPTALMLRADHAGHTRSPAADRDLLLVREPTATGAWEERGIVSVSVANCPDGRAALVLGLDTPVSAAGFARIVEPVRLRTYRSGAVHALGMEGRLGGATIQPLAGPLDSTGFQATRSGHLLRMTLSRAPLLPLLLSLPLGPSP